MPDGSVPLLIAIIGLILLSGFFSSMETAYSCASRIKLRAKANGGNKLAQKTLKLAEDMDIPFVFVIGDEDYYHRFGFESASKYNVRLNGCDIDGECPFFMIKIFNVDEITLKKGIFSNPDVFDVDENDVDEFDKRFEFRQKEVNENQLGV